MKRLIPLVLVVFGLGDGPVAGARAPQPMPEGICRVARDGLATLWAQVPRARVTSARRSRHDEARAWARNIARKRRWMGILAAADRPELVAAQAWIDANWKRLRGRPAPIEEHLLAVFETLPDAEMSRISPHFGGSAIDLATHPRITRRVLSRLPNVRVVLFEGDHWHVDFDCDERLVH